MISKAVRKSSRLPYRWIALALLMSLAFGCAGAPQNVCRKSGFALVSDQLFFGTERPEGAVTPEEWRGFLEEAVTPRFPDGFTSWDAAGQWREPDGRILSERSYVLVILHRDGPDSDEAVKEIVLAYKKRFRQRAVLQVRSPACASFWESDSGK